MCTPARTFRLLLLVAVTSASASIAPAAPITYTLSFDSLPSAQGMTYTAAGVHAATLESSIFSVHGDRLLLDSIGEPFAVAGGGAFYAGLGGSITANEPKLLRVSARCLQTEGTGPGSDGRGAFGFGFAVGSTQYTVSITPTRIFSVDAVGIVPVPGTYDNASTFHEYRLVFLPPSTQNVYRDGVLVHTSNVGFTFTASRLLFGDLTGGANARAEIGDLYFEQAATLDAPAPGTAVLALRGAVRNPSPATRLEVAFTLPTAEPARIALLDVSGRRVLARDLDGTGAGAHVLRLDPPAGLAAGVYWLRLEQAGQQRTAKVVLAE